MRLFKAVLTAFFVAVQIGAAQSDEGLSGLWKFNPARSEVRNLPAPPALFLKAEQDGKELTLFSSSEQGGPSTRSIYRLAGRAGRTPDANATTNPWPKGAGTALLVIPLLTGHQNNASA